MAKHIPTQKFALAIDFETSGLTVGDYAKHHQALTFGAHIFDLNTLEIKESLYKVIKFDDTKYEWTTRAEQIHGLSREHLAANGVPMEEAAFALAELIARYNGTEEVIVLGHRPYFDIAFIVQLMDSIDLELKFDPIKLDTAAFGLVFYGVTSSDELFELSGLPPRKEHNALEDITYTLASLAKMKEYLLAGLEASVK